MTFTSALTFCAQKVDIELVNTSAMFGNVSIHTMDFLEEGGGGFVNQPPQVL